MALCIVAGWGSNSGKGKLFSSISQRPQRLWDPTSLLFNGYMGKRPEREATISPPTTTEIRRDALLRFRHVFMTHRVISQLQGQFTLTECS
jgi:hypothetical protein